MWVPGAVQLSVCISVNTCTQLHILHGFTTVPTYCQSTLCTLKVSQQCERCCVTMVTGPPWVYSNLECEWTLLANCQHLPSHPSVCYYSAHSSQNRIISAVAPLLLSLSFHVKRARRWKSLLAGTHEHELHYVFTRLSLVHSVSGLTFI